MTISGISSNSSIIGQMSSQRSNAALGAIERNVPKEKEKTENLFATLDANSSGRLDTTEIESLIEKISEATGVSVDLSEFLNTYDADGDTLLSEEETAAALEANRPPGPPPGRGMGRPDESDMVSAADADEDGLISEEEAESLVEIINHATGSTLQAADFVEAYDKDGNGLSAEEAVAAMEANRPQEPPVAMMGGMGRMEGGSSDVAQLFADADTNGDEVLNGEEMAAALEANRPAGPPPPPGQTGTAEETDPFTAAAIEQYLKMAALGVENQTSGTVFSLGNEAGSRNSIA